MFARATSVFIPANRPSIRLAYALLQEEQGQIEEARKFYKDLLEAGKFDRSDKIISLGIITRARFTIIF